MRILWRARTTKQLSLLAITTVVQTAITDYVLAHPVTLAGAEMQMAILGVSCSLRMSSFSGYHNHFTCVDIYERWIRPWE